MVEPPLINPTSILHRNFSLLSLNYDVLEACFEASQEEDKSQPSKAVATQKRTNVLVIRDPSGDPQNLRVSDTIYRDLTEAKKGFSVDLVLTNEEKEDLVTLGLCSK